MRIKSEFGEYGIFELLPIEYIRDIAASKNPNLKGTSKTEIISKLYNERLLNKEDLENARNYYDQMILAEKDNSMSCSIVKLSEIPQNENFIAFFKDNLYEYDNDKNIVSKDGYKISSEDPIKFEYWYDKKTIEINPNNYAVDEEHISKSVSGELDKKNKLLSFNTYDSRKVSKVMNSLIFLDTLKVHSLLKAISKEESYQHFMDFIDKVDSELNSLSESIKINPDNPGYFLNERNISRDLDLYKESPHNLYSWENPVLKVYL